MAGLMKKFGNLFIDLSDRILENFRLSTKQIWSLYVSGPLYIFNNLLHAAVLAFNAFQEFTVTVRLSLLTVAVLAALVPLSFYSCLTAFLLIVRYNAFAAKLNPVLLEPPILRHPKYGQHKYASIKGVTLHYVEKGDMDKPVILFLHGFSEFWFTWRNQIVEFSDQNYRTVAIDMRGFGGSDKPLSKSDYELHVLIQDLKNFIEYINPNQKQQLFVVAHGWGAVILYCFLLQYGHLVNAYITLNIVPPYVVRLTIRQIIDSWKVYLYQVPFVATTFIRAYLPKFLLNTYGRLNEDKEEVIKSYYYTLGKNGAYKCPLQYFRANLTKLVQYRLYGSQVLVCSHLPPGLCLYGEDDDMVEEVSFKYACLVPNLQTLKVLQAGYKMTELNPTLINRLIQRFLTDLKPREYPKKSNYVSNIRMRNGVFI